MRDAETTSFTSFDRLVLAVAASALAGSLYFLAFADSIRDGSSGEALVGKVATRKGDVRHRSQYASSWSEAREGDRLYEGDGVFTGDESRTEIVLEHGDQFGVEAKSLVVMRASSGQVELDLRYGSLESEIVKGQKIVLNIDGRRQELGGDGARIRLKRALREAFAQIEVLEGEVDVRVQATTEDGQPSAPKLVHKSEIVRIGESMPVAQAVQVVQATPAPAAPQEVEPAKIDSPLLTNPTVTWTFPHDARPLGTSSKASADGLPALQWSRVAAAASYRVEVARSQDFTNAEKFESNEPSWKLTQAALGPLYWRVTAIASDGSESSASSTAAWQLKADSPSPMPIAAIERAVDKQNKFDQGKERAPLPRDPVARAIALEAPLAIEPSASASVVAMNGAPIFVNFAWAPTPGATYELQIAGNDQFTAPAYSLTLQKPAYFLNERLSSGEMFWRVRAKVGKRVSPWSAATRFTVIAR